MANANTCMALPTTEVLTTTIAGEPEGGAYWQLPCVDKAAGDEISAFSLDIGNSFFASDFVFLPLRSGGWVISAA